MPKRNKTAASAANGLPKGAPEQTPGSDFLTVDEVAKILRVHRRTIVQLLLSGQLPGFRVGRQWRVRRSVLSAWIEEQDKRAAT